MSKPAVPRLWPGETFAILASGPSLTPADVESVRGRARVIAINATYALAPWADVLYCADPHPFKWYWNKGPKGYESVRMSEFAGLKYTVTTNKWPGVTVLGRDHKPGLSLDPTKLALGGNSGYQAINLAVLLGASRIVLLGYDMQRSRGKMHWHADHPGASSLSQLQHWPARFRQLVEPLKVAHVEVLNCTRDTALTCFPRPELESVFPVLAEAVA